jgi:hypothetical protein
LENSQKGKKMKAWFREDGFFTFSINPVFTVCERSFRISFLVGFGLPFFLFMNAMGIAE